MVGAVQRDFSLAEEINRTLGFRCIGFQDSLDKGGQINWHGPGPLILHFHLDIAPTKALSNDHR